MKTKTSAPISSTRRCKYRTATGRQCCSQANARSGFCARHAAAQEKLQARDYAGLLVRESSGFQNARGINFSLGDLYALLAQGRISPRRAAVLANISSLLLRTLRAIDTDGSPEADRDIDLSPVTELDAIEELTQEASGEPGSSPDLSHPDSDGAGKTSKPN